MQNERELKIASFRNRIKTKYWVIVLLKGTAIRKIDLSAGNILEMNDKWVRVRFHRFHLFPTTKKIEFDKMKTFLSFIDRHNPLSDADLKNLNQQNSSVRRREFRKAAFMKWSVIIGFLLILTLVALLVVFFKK